jgi:ribokinase
LVTPEFVQQSGEQLVKDAKVVIIQLEIPIESSLQALRLSRKHGAISIFNVAPAVSNLPKEMFSLSDILCVNESEVTNYYSTALKVFKYAIRVYNDV